MLQYRYWYHLDRVGNQDHPHLCMVIPKLNDDQTDHPLQIMGFDQCFSWLQFFIQLRIPKFGLAYLRKKYLFDFHVWFPFLPNLDCNPWPSPTCPGRLARNLLNRNKRPTRFGTRFATRFNYFPFGGPSIRYAGQGVDLNNNSLNPGFYPGLILCCPFRASIDLFSLNIESLFRFISSVFPLPVLNR